MAEQQKNSGAKKVLSGNVLEMKFMQRTRRRMEEEQRRRDEDRLARSYLEKKTVAGTEDGDTVVATAVVGVEQAKTKASASTSVSGQSRPSVAQAMRVVFERRYELLEDLKFGRQSFNGFNPQVEKLMRYYEDLRDGIRPEDGELEGDSQCKDVDDDEMAETLGGSSAAGMMSKRFLTKKQRNNSRPMKAQTRTHDAIIDERMELRGGERGRRGGRRGRHQGDRGDDRGQGQQGIDHDQSDSIKQKKQRLS